jgi:hypothetical protein
VNLWGQHRNSSHKKARHCRAFFSEEPQCKGLVPKRISFAVAAHCRCFNAACAAASRAMEQINGKSMGSDSIDLLHANPANNRGRPRFPIQSRDIDLIRGKFEKFIPDMLIVPDRYQFGDTTMPV